MNQNKSKACCTCKKEIPINEYSWKIKKRSKRSTKCKDCTNEYSRQHYKNNINDYVARAKKNRARYKKEGRNLIYEFKLSNPCTSCGESNPIVLEFDHLDPQTKRNDVSTMATHGYSIESLEKEIEKCIILCANCHRQKTAKQQNWHSYKQNKRSKQWEEQ